MKKLLALSMLAVLMMGVIAGCAPAANDAATEEAPAGEAKGALDPTETAEPN